MGTWDLPDIYTHALWSAALGLGHIYQANPLCPCCNYNIKYSYRLFLVVLASMIGKFLSMVLVLASVTRLMTHILYAMLNAKSY